MANLIDDLNETSQQHANTILAYCCEHADGDWRKVLRQTLSDTEYKWAVTQIGNRLAEIQKDSPVGAVVGGTGVLKVAVGLGGEDAQRAIRLLKATNRLIQLGKGRGKALVVLTPEKLKLDAPKVAEIPQSIPDLLHATLAEYERMAQELKVTREELEAAKVELDRRVAANW